MIPSSTKLREAAPRVAFELVFALFTLHAARPAFATQHLPLQDLPQHMAAISVLKRLPFDAHLREYFEPTLSRTQYLLVYLLGVLLAVPFSVEYATRLLVALTVVAIPYSLRFALKRTGGDERLACLAWPFLWNPQMMLGFLNYLLGIPLALLAIGLFADAHRRTERKRQVLLALLAAGAFFSHLVPFGLLGLGVLLQLQREEKPNTESWLAHGKRCVQRWIRELLFLLPAFGAVLLWIVRSPARDQNVRAGGVGRELVLTWPDRLALPDEFRNTVLQAHGQGDELALLGWGMGLLAALALGDSRADGPKGATQDDRADHPILPGTVSRRVRWLPALCAVLYVASPNSYGWIWPIHTRFAVAAVLLLPLALPKLKSSLGAALLVLGMGFATYPLAQELREDFQRWDREELAELDEALDHAEPGKRLVALVPASGSRWIPGNVPLLHAAAYYQLHGGAVATFSFADFPQSPFRYREDGPRPPKLQPRWEWESSLRTADPTRSYYDYVLVRTGASNEAAAQPELYAEVFRGPNWKLYQRRGSTAQ